MDNLIKNLIKQKKFSYQKLLTAKLIYARKNKQPLPRNSEILGIYKTMLAKKKIKASKRFEELLRLKKIRTLSGVSPVAVLTKPYPCPGRCIYCPTQKNMPKSYLSDEPAVLRANALDFAAYKQVKFRLTQYEAIGHTPEKIELIVMGGTWSALPKDYRIKFISDCFRACNNSGELPFELQQQLNEKAKYRIIGLTLETRPDYINESEIKFMRFLGATRVELGVQSIYDDVLALVKRGHKVADTIKATKLLKDAGFKICYHLMPNLPGSNLKKDLEMFKIVYKDERFKPDMVKIYPCVVTKQAELNNWYQAGKFKPYRDKELTDLLVKIKKITPQWVRINRLGRDIPISNITGGCKISNIRQLLKTNCRCIRCREIRNSKSEIRNPKLKIITYQASGGSEYFLQYVDSKNRLYSLLRLRITGQAIIREVHTYGQALAIRQLAEGNIQHSGLGKKLIERAEKIAKTKSFKKISVISGVGVRDYYCQLGYHLADTYMVKLL